MLRPLIAALAILALAPGVAPARDRTLTVIEHATSDATIDLGPQGDSPGDLLVFHNDVFDARDRRKVGTDQGRCIRIDPAAGSYECAWTVILHGGQLMVEGPYYENRDSTLAVTGGTGRYRGAGGEMRLHSMDNGKKVEFAFRLDR